MSQQDAMDNDGIRNDGVSYEPGAPHFTTYVVARGELASFQEPVLLHTDNPHERLYIATFDGTGNDKFRDPGHETNVGHISDQIEALRLAGNRQIGGDYVEGPGTQQHRPLAHLLDGVRGSTVDERAEQMYEMFINQAKQWRHDDPGAQIRVVSVSFSRGSEEGALLARLIDERGIQDPSGARYTYDAHQQIKHVEYTKPPLVPPHRVAQAVVMLDPVGTGRAMHEDRRLPPSVISGIEFIAMDEHRGLFKSDRIIDPGITADGRFAGIYVPGAHSDVGGGYHRDGLAIRTGNFAIDYVNGLCDRPILDKREEPDDSRLNVIHHSQDGVFLYRILPTVNRMEAGGYNELEVPAHDRARVSDPYDAEPRDESLSRQFARQAMPNAPQPNAPARGDAESALEQWIDRMYLASQNADDQAWDQVRHAASETYLHSPAGLQFQQQANDLNIGWDMQLQAQLQAARHISPEQATPGLGR